MSTHQDSHNCHDVSETPSDILQGIYPSTNLKSVTRKKRRSSVDERSLAFNLSRAESSKTLKKRIKAPKMLTTQNKIRKTNEFNFIVGSGAEAKRFKFEELSLGCLSRSNRFRQFFVRVIAHPMFENFILFMILLNAIFFSIADYTHVDENGDIVEEGSSVNAVIIRTNLVFLVVFSAEFVVKVIAQGFIGTDGAYLK